ncbi:MAG: carbohydrate kinase family protein [Candidatus Syntropharchaeia archaeon]
MDVVGLGALNFDMLYLVEKIAKGGEEVGIIKSIRSPGGSAANTIVGLARLGAEVGFIGIVGNDMEGRMILDEFSSERVDTKGIVVSEGRTGIAIGFIDSKSGERALYIDPGVNDRFDMKNVDVDYINAAKFLHTSSFVDMKQLEMQKELVKQVKTRISFNPGMLCFKYGFRDIKGIIERSEVVFLSEKELFALTRAGPERGAEILLETGAEIVAITLGKRGCYVTDGNGSHFIPAYPTDVVDTTGAGDSFSAGFLYSLIQGRSIEECGKFGNKIASFCVRNFGAREGLPYGKDVV